MNDLIDIKDVECFGFSDDSEECMLCVLYELCTGVYIEDELSEKLELGFKMGRGE